MHGADGVVSLAGDLHVLTLFGKNDENYLI
jgi:hypothetical protein